MRILVVLLLLAAPALAGPGSWQAARYGSNENQDGTPANASGNATHMEVIAHAVSTYVQAFLMTCTLEADESGSATDTDTVWYGLEFVGDDTASDPSWKIETDIDGIGTAWADVSLSGSAWAESLEAISVAGDCKNSGAGILAVDNSTAAAIRVGLPPSFAITVTRTTRKINTDVYDVKSEVASTGKGKVCRIRVDTYAEATGSASSYVHASVSALGHLTLNLTMTGTVNVKGQKVRDRFRIKDAIVGKITATETEAPSGGIENRHGTIPTNTPTQAEREGEKDDDAIDAADLPDEEPDEKDESGGSTTADDSDSAVTGE